MASLQQEMRNMFDKHCSMDFNEKKLRLEDGLLEKIINLSFANLRLYNIRPWKITAVKSPALLQKLYKTVNDRRIIECAVALIVIDDLQYGSTSDMLMYEKERDNDLQLLSMSIMYAAKYNFIDSILIKEFNKELVVREFALDRKKPVAAIVCLGCFDNRKDIAPLFARHTYSDIVKEI